jgi:hypothetical protein
VSNLRIDEIVRDSSKVKDQNKMLFELKVYLGRAEDVLVFNVDM